MKKIFAIITAALLASCSSGDSAGPDPQPADTFIRSADISFLPELEATGTPLYNGAAAQDMITTLKANGCNTVRIRLWKDPANGHSGLAEVTALANRAKQAGLKVWLTVHFSDTWADPGQQTIPAAWQPLDFDGLKTAVSGYTSQILTAVQPDIFQIGNETNDGFLWPMGKLSTSESHCLELMSAVASTVRNQSPHTKIMLHFAGLTGATWFFSKTAGIDYDYIGLSYYPVWHGKDLSQLSSLIGNLGATYSKKVLIAETAYPFTLGWNDWTNNIVGQDDQLIPGYDATPDGQKAYLQAIKTMLKSSAAGQGFSYWGGEWISFMGPEATNGSTWENQALYDFDNKALPAMGVFNAD